MFWIIGPLMVIASLALPFARKTVHAAVGLIFVMIGMAFLYTTLEAPFLGVAQVVVYTGAIMILFVFVLMLVGVDASDSVAETIKGQRWIAFVLGAGLLAVLAGVLVTANLPEAAGLGSANANTNPAGVAYVIFGQLVFSLELVGVLLIVAALGAITLTHKERLSPIRDQASTLRLRMRAYARGEGSHVLTPMPAPGVYALHNAADVPALDPEGKPIDISVPRVLRIRGQELSPASVDGHVAQIAAGAFLQPSRVTSSESEATLEAAELEEIEHEESGTTPEEVVQLARDLQEESRHTSPELDLDGDANDEKGTSL